MAQITHQILGHPLYSFPAFYDRLPSSNLTEVKVNKVPNVLSKLSDNDKLYFDEKNNYIKGGKNMEYFDRSKCLLGKLNYYILQGHIQG